MKTKHKKTQSHCVASVSARVRREQLDQSEKRDEGGGGGGGGKYLPTNAHPGGDYLTILCVSLRERGRGESLVSVSCSRLHVILRNRRKNTIFWAKSPVNILLLTTLKHYHAVTNDRTYKINTIA